MSGRAGRGVPPGASHEAVGAVSARAVSPAASDTPQPGGRFAVSGVIIDLDGTLLDTVDDLAAAVNAMLADLGRAPLPLARVRDFVGKGAEVLVHRVLTGALDGRAASADFAPAMTAFLHHYRRENGLRARRYPGVTEGLEAMRAAGLRLAVVTNKPQAFTVPLLRQQGLSDYFELVVSGDSLPKKKPDPMPMLHVCERFGVPPQRMLAIGDSVNDARAARAAGMRVMAVPYGYNEGLEVQSLDVDAIVATLFHAASLVDCV